MPASLTKPDAIPVATPTGAIGADGLKKSMAISLTIKSEDNVTHIARPPPIPPAPFRTLLTRAANPAGMSDLPTALQIMPAKPAKTPATHRSLKSIPNIKSTTHLVNNPEPQASLRHPPDALIGSASPPPLGAPSISPPIIVPIPPTSRPTPSLANIGANVSGLSKLPKELGFATPNPTTRPAPVKNPAPSLQAPSPAPTPPSPAVLPAILPPVTQFHQTAPAPMNISALPGPVPTQIAHALAAVIPGDAPGSQRLLIAMAPPAVGQVSIQIDRSTSSDTHVIVTATHPDMLQTLKHDSANLITALATSGIAVRHQDIEYRSMAADFPSFAANAPGTEASMNGGSAAQQNGQGQSGQSGTPLASPAPTSFSTDIPPTVSISMLGGLQSTTLYPFAINLTA